MSALRVGVAGIGVWCPPFIDWPTLQRGAVLPDSSIAVPRPVPRLLPPAERRRVPDGVAVALEVAREALAQAAPAGAGGPALSSVFASAHGDLAIVDYLCRTLADEPLSLSPLRFHHSVHNAAAGYWTIATPSTGPSTSIAAGVDSFAVALVEAAAQAIAEERPVLLVAFDTPAVGPLGEAAPNTALFGAALLLTPAVSGDALATLSMTIDARPVAMPSPVDPTLQALAVTSPSARSLALLEALARGGDATVAYPIHADASVSVSVRSETTAGAGSAPRTIE